jgi:hypothetical protein
MFVNEEKRWASSVMVFEQQSMHTLASSVIQHTSPRCLSPGAKRTSVLWTMETALQVQVRTITSLVRNTRCVLVRAYVDVSWDRPAP